MLFRALWHLSKPGFGFGLVFSFLRCHPVLTLSYRAAGTLGKAAPRGHRTLGSLHLFSPCHEGVMVFFIPLCVLKQRVLLWEE